MLSDELQKLYNLYEQGAISEAEYAEVKQRLLKQAQRRKPDGLLGLDVRGYKVLLHASQYAGHVAPLVGLVVPILLWVNARRVSPEIDQEGKYVLNWIISEIVYIVLVLVIAGFTALAGFIIGILLSRGEMSAFGGLLLFISYGGIYVGLGLIALLGTVFPLIGILRSMKGESFRYPLSIPFVK